MISSSARQLYVQPIWLSSYNKSVLFLLSVITNKLIINIWTGNGDIVLQGQCKEIIIKHLENASNKCSYVPVQLEHSAWCQRQQTQHAAQLPQHLPELDKTACGHHHPRSAPSWRVGGSFCFPHEIDSPMLIRFCLLDPSTCNINTRC